MVMTFVVSWKRPRSPHKNPCSKFMWGRPVSLALKAPFTPPR